MLNNHFDGRPGSELVNTGLYEIMNEQSKGALTIKDWEETIVPGMALSMSILLKRQQRTSDRTGESCPSCEAPYKGYGKCKDLERVRWYSRYYLKFFAEELIIHSYKLQMWNSVPNIFSATGCRALG